MPKNSYPKLYRIYKIRIFLVNSHLKIRKNTVCVFTHVFTTCQPAIFHIILFLPDRRLKTKLASSADWSLAPQRAEARSTGESRREKSTEVSSTIAFIDAWA